MNTENNEYRLQEQDLAQLREQIDEIDREIVRLYEERMQVSDRVGEYKIRTGRKVYDKERERAKIGMVRNLASTDFSKKESPASFSSR